IAGEASGFERVRWKSSAFSPQPAMMPRTFAPRASALSSDSSTRAAEPSASTKPSRSLENGFDAFSGNSFWVDRADSSEKRVSSATADRLDAELDRGGARCASGRKRDRQAARAKTVGEAVSDRAELGALEGFTAQLLARYGQEPLVGWQIVVGAVIEREAVAPVELDGRRGQEKRAAEIMGREARAGDGFQRRQFRELVGKGAGALVARRQEVDGTADRRVEVVRREARDRVDARTPRGQRSPVILNALSERRDDADAGDGNDRAAEVVGGLGHRPSPKPRRRGQRPRNDDVQWRWQAQPSARRQVPPRSQRRMPD